MNIESLQKAIDKKSKDESIKLSAELSKDIRKSLGWVQYSGPNTSSGFDSEIIKQMNLESLGAGYHKKKISETFENFSSNHLNFCIDIISKFSELMHEKSLSNKITQDLISMQDQLNELSGIIEDIE